ncbi:hypothetical protein [Staphylococcus equorum]|nr:hypothetical protein [Staphylococcus equorum]KKI53585.1 hypothetical protein UF72_2446 [Staphylococcus equorum subsp. equorum]
MPILGSYCTVPLLALKELLALVDCAGGILFISLSAAVKKYPLVSEV